jgi:hypothetical protein
MSLDEELAELEREREDADFGEDESDEEDENAKEKPDAGINPFRLSDEEVAELIEKPGPWQEFWRIAKELREARAERAAKELAAAEAEADLDAGVFDWDDPAALDGLRARVIAEREADAAAFIPKRRAELRKQGYGDATIEQKIKDEQVALAQADAFLAASDPLHSHPAWQEHQRQLAEERRARSVASGRGREPDGYLGDLQEAEDYIAQMKAKAVS